MARYRTFLKEFLRSPATTGAIAPSSSALADAMTSSIHLSKSKVVVEFGPGTGAFTSTILRLVGRDTTFFAIERSPIFAEILRSRFPDLDLVQGSAEALPAALGDRGETAVDAIISGLPWAAFDAVLQDRITSVVREHLSPEGTFATFAYVHGLILPSAWRFRKLLRRKFSRVAVSKVVWLNLPPAIIYRCRI